MSSEEQFEHIEHKIKEAAENNEIVFEEKAWDKMEALLEKEDKKRPFFWLWFALPLIIIGGYSAYQFSNATVLNKTNVPIINKKNTEKIFTPTSASNTAQLNIQKLTTATQHIPTTALANNVNNIPNTFASAVNNSYKNIYQKKYKSLILSSVGSKKTTSTINDDKINDEILQNKNIKNSTSKTRSIIKNADATEDEIVTNTTTENKKRDTVISQKINANVIENIKKDSNISITKNASLRKENTKNKSLSRFYILAAAGEDIGSVKLFSFANSSFSAKYGGSLGFDINKRLSVQAGFYASKKKYIAGPEDYNVKAGSYWSIAPITKVEAACLIYELPIVLQYKFLQRKSVNVYIGAGASTYIMKMEEYNYFYKRYNIEYSKANTYTGNQHLFSTALLSAGVEKNITKKLALQLEPTISVPLKGVGDGAVKLFSTSLLLAVKYKLFKK
jgi:Outer membrane protein beta-barrel domain